MKKEKLSARLLLQVNDELVLECRQEELSKTAQEKANKCEWSQENIRLDNIWAIANGYSTATSISTHGPKLVEDGLQMILDQKTGYIYNKVGGNDCIIANLKNGLENHLKAIFGSSGMLRKIKCHIPDKSVFQKFVFMIVADISD